MRHHVVRTPEGVEFRYALAGPAERMCAYLMDLLCMGILFVGVLIAAARTGPAAPFLSYLGIFLVQWGYFLFFEWRWDGATPGKRWLGLKVLQTEGSRCGMERLVLRNFLRVLDSQPFPYGIGALSMLLNRRGGRIGDLAAGTVVVRIPRAPAPEAAAEVSRRFNSLKEDVQARQRIRVGLSPEEGSLVVSLALRRDLLEAAPRLRLFADTADYLRKRLKLSQRHEGLPDESLVLNVAAVVLEEKSL